MEKRKIMSSDSEFLTIAEAARLIGARKLSPVELTQRLLRRTDALEPQLNAYITLTRELALERAREAESAIMRGDYRGPLHGIPFALKDIYNTAGILTSGHSKIGVGNIPREDAAAAAKLREAGAVLLGKLATSEYAHGGPSFEAPWPPARNPWNTEHFTGGSSSGSGAAVAAGLALGAMGSDTGGSIRIPASFCGTVGLKPTYGLVSRYGVIPNSYTFDHCGPLTWTVEDTAIMLQAIAGYDARDAGSAKCAIPDYRSALTEDLQGLRIGVIRHFYEEDLPLGAEVGAAMSAAIEVLSKLGARIETVRVRPLTDFFDVKIIIAESEIFAVHQKELIERPRDFGTHFLGQTLGACLFSGTDYVQAQRERRRILVEMEAIYAKYDAVLTASPGPAPRIDAYRIVNAWQKPNICTPFNVTAGPALALCNGFTAQGLPLSMQIVGRPFDEATVMRIGHAYEKATPWRSRRPRLEPGAAAPAVTLQPHLAGAPEIDAAMRARADAHAEQAGLKLPPELQGQLYAAAPYAFAMAKRIRRGYDRSEEPSNVFRHNHH
jgi:aspartyl-tRNA(Asn)/glutamyl-tRNA(Gln) amidotransferase subunit A